MKTKINKLLTIMLAAAVMAAATFSNARETTGVLGSPSATTTIFGKQLPAPDPKFGGVIKNDALSSKAWWAPRIVPPKDAPNFIVSGAL